MYISNILKAIRAIGTSLLITGELLKRLGSAIRVPNLGTRSQDESDRQNLSQDPSTSIGEEGEEPVENQRELPF